MSSAKLIPLCLYLLMAAASPPSNTEGRRHMPPHSTNLGHLTDLAYHLNMEESVKGEIIQSRPSDQSSTSQLTAKEKELLDRLMLRLKRESTATGWIRIDLERRRVDEAALTDLVVRYLKSKYGAEFDRVSVMGAYRLDQEMELFIVPRVGDPIPFPQKTSKSKCSKRGRSKQR